MLEKDIERYFVRQVAHKLNGKAYKFTSPANRSVPDRIVMAPGGIIFLCEMKRPGAEPTKKQWKCIEDIRRFGIPVHVCDKKLLADIIIDIYVKKQKKILGVLI